MIEVKRTTTTKLKINNACVTNNELVSEDDELIDLMDVINQYFTDGTEVSILVTTKDEELV